VKQRAYGWVKCPFTTSWWTMYKHISIIGFIIDVLKFNVVIAVIYENYVLIFLKIK
jgi:hypothetical protein